MEHSPQQSRKNKKKKKRGGSGVGSPLSHASSPTISSSPKEVPREDSAGSITLDVEGRTSPTPSSIDASVLNAILEGIRVLVQPNANAASNTVHQEPDSSSALLQRIESEKAKVRHEIEKKLLEEENSKLKGRVVELSDLNEHWKTKYYTLEAEHDIRHTESDANLIEVYSRIQELEHNITKLEADRSRLLLEVKLKDAQIDEWKEKYLDLQSQSEKRIDITNFDFNHAEERKDGANYHARSQKAAEEPHCNGEKEIKEEKEIKVVEEPIVEKKEDVKEDNVEQDKKDEDGSGGDEENDSSEEETKGKPEEKKESSEETQEEVIKENSKEEKEEKQPEQEAKKEEDEPKKEDEEKKEEEDENKEEEKKDEEKKEDDKREPLKRKYRSRLEKAMASGNMEFMSTATLDTQFARAIQQSKSFSPLTSPVTATSRTQELEAIADILKHSSTDLDALNSSAEPEDNVDDLMSNLNKITYHEGALGGLPSTFSFTDLDRVSSYGTLSDIEAEEQKAKEEEGKETKPGTLRISEEKREKLRAGLSDTELYIKKIVLVQSIVRRHQARRKYKQIRKRAAIAKEIFLTERTYVKHLDTCIKVFLRPLRQRAMVSEAGFITLERLQTIFSTFEIIRRANYALLKRLHAVITSWNVSSIIGPIFTELLPLLEPHVDYIVNFENAQSLLREATKESTALAMFLKASLQNPDLDCKDLADFLIMPVQRIPRYVMLLIDLLRNTPQSHPDYVNIQLASTKMRDFADSINERKRSQYRVFQLKDCITGLKDLDLFHSGRFMLAEGDLKSKKGMEHFFLFNDVLVACKMKKGMSSSTSASSLSPSVSSSSLGSNSPSLASTPSEEHNLFKFISRINIDNHAHVEDTKEAKHPTNFKLVLGDHSSHVFSAPTVEDKVLWMGAFNKAILHSPSAHSGPHTGGYDISTTDLRQLA